ncbi:hypothetical protein GCK32_011096 [Trichostrongylus colubriformis]|uniref:Uncharacterized protein n=1 Tax=Trichostrongylus colubriformis TaxID=6319 RepID=A0AAN8G3S9_TRICO
MKQYPGLRSLIILGVSFLLVSSSMSQEGFKENGVSTTSSAGIRASSLPLDRTQSDHIDNYYANLDPDKLMNEYGFGRYQWFTYVLCEGMNFFYSSAMYVMPYVGLNPKLECTYKVTDMTLHEVHLAL